MRPAKKVVAIVGLLCLAGGRARSEDVLQEKLQEATRAAERSKKELTASKSQLGQQARLNHNFMIAVKSDDPGAVRRALQAGADVDVPNQWVDDTPDNAGPYQMWPALFIAVTRQQPQIVGILVDEYRADVNAAPSFYPFSGETALTQAVKSYCYETANSNLKAVLDPSSEARKKKKRAFDVLNILLLDPRTKLSEKGGTLERYNLASGMTPLDHADHDCSDFGRLAMYLRSKGAKNSELFITVHEMQDRR